MLSKILNDNDIKLICDLYELNVAHNWSLFSLITYINDIDILLTTVTKPPIFDNYELQNRNFLLYYECVCDLTYKKELIINKFKSDFSKQIVRSILQGI